MCMCSECVAEQQLDRGEAPVDSMVILDHLAYLAYHLYTLDALSRCTYPLRWGVLRADLRAEFMERAAIAYRMWHDSECESRADCTARFPRA